MSINWPFVSRHRLDAAEFECRSLRLERELYVKEISHLRRARLDLIARLAKAAREIRELTVERDEWHKEAAK